MQSLASTAFTLGVIGYSVAATLFTIDLARRERLPLVAQWGPRVALAAVVAHFAHIVMVSILTRSCPVGSVHFALTVAALVAVVGYLMLRRRSGLHVLGAVVMPTALAFMVMSEFVGQGRPVGTLDRGLLSIHVTANLLGVAVLVLAAAAALLYLVQERRLREKRMGWGSGKLPPLEVLDATLHRLLLVGFPLLTLGLITGAVFASQVDYGAPVQAARVALSYAAWGVVAGVLVMRRLAGWRGRRAAYGAIAGVVCILTVVALYVLVPGVGAAT